MRSPETFAARTCRLSKRKSRCAAESTSFRRKSCETSNLALWSHKTTLHEKIAPWCWRLILSPPPDTFNSNSEHIKRTGDQYSAISAALQHQQGVALARLCVAAEQCRHRLLLHSLERKTLNTRKQVPMAMHGNRLNIHVYYSHLTELYRMRHVDDLTAAGYLLKLD